MKRKLAWTIGGMAVIFICAAVYGLVFPAFGSRATVSFLGYTEHRGGRLAVFQLMNHTHENIAVLPGTFVLRTPHGTVFLTNETPELYGEIPPGILTAQTSATFALRPPAVTNAWCLEMQFIEFRRRQPWEVTARRFLKKVGLRLPTAKPYKLLTPELQP